MDPNLLILTIPLLGGYYFASQFYLTRFRIERMENQKLIFESSFWAVIFLILSFFFYYIGVIFFPCYPDAWIGWRVSNFCIDSYWKKIIPIEYSGIAVGALILGASAWIPLNFLFDKASMIKLLINEEGDSFELLLLKSADERKQILITLNSGKVYSGIVSSPMNPAVKSENVAISTYFTGYWETETRNIISQFFYTEDIKKSRENFERIADLFLFIVFFQKLEFLTGFLQKRRKSYKRHIKIIRVKKYFFGILHYFLRIFSTQSFTNTCSKQEIFAKEKSLNITKSKIDVIEGILTKLKNEEIIRELQNNGNGLSRIQKEFLLGNIIPIPISQVNDLRNSLKLEIRRIFKNQFNDEKISIKIRKIKEGLNQIKLYSNDNLFDLNKKIIEPLDEMIEERRNITYEGIKEILEDYNEIRDRIINRLKSVNPQKINEFYSIAKKLCEIVAEIEIGQRYNQIEQISNLESEFIPKLFRQIEKTELNLKNLIETEDTAGSLYSTDPIENAPQELNEYYENILKPIDIKLKKIEELVNTPSMDLANIRNAYHELKELEGKVRKLNIKELEKYQKDKIRIIAIQHFEIAFNFFEEILRKKYEKMEEFQLVVPVEQIVSVSYFDKSMLDKYKSKIKTAEAEKNKPKQILVKF